MTQSIGVDGQIDPFGGIRTADAAIGAEEVGTGLRATTREEDPLGGLSALARGDAEILTGVARAMYPHDRLPDLHYQRVVASLDEKAAADPAFLEVLTGGIGMLATTTGRRPEDFASLPEAEQVAALTRLEHGPFFSAVAAEVVVNLYSQPDVWPYFGYEGPSNDKGGYLHRGFDDIDWLDDAPDRRGEAVPDEDHTVRESAVAGNGSRA